MSLWNIGTSSGEKTPGLLKAIIATAGFIVLLVAIWGFLHPPVSREMLQELDVLLDDYSHTLGTGESAKATYYSPEMQDLIENRQWFYAEYFEVGLMSELQTLTSEFLYHPRRAQFVSMLIDTLNDVKSADMLWNVVRGRSVAVPTHARVQVLSADRISLRVTEVITFHARYNVPPDEYPRVLGAHWALERTDDPQVRQQLQELIASDTEQTRTTFEDGYEMVFIVYHTMVLQHTPTGLQVVEDVFTDRDAIFPGVDNVTWVQGNFVRNTRGLTTTAEYLLYHKSIEEIGENLLRRYSGAW